MHACNAVPTAESGGAVLFAILTSTSTREASLLRARLRRPGVPSPVGKHVRSARAFASAAEPAGVGLVVRATGARRTGAGTGDHHPGAPMSRPSLSNAVRTGLAAEKVDEVVDEYRGLYAEERGGDAAARREAYTRLVNHYYDLVTDFYEFGWGQSFHFGVRRRGESFPESLRRHEYWLAARLGLVAGRRALDVGCGVGGPMRNIAAFSGAHVVGINNNAYQIGRGERHDAKAGLADRCSYVKGDFLKMPLDDASFDAAYAIEATCHAPDRVPVFAEVFRVLKPGALFASYEWCLTDRFEPSNAEHQRLKRGIEEGDALPDLVHTSVVDRALEHAGFEVLETTDRVDACDPETPWYLPLAGELSPKGLPRTAWGRPLVHGAVRALEALRVAPRGATQVSDVLNLAADALVRAGELRIFTPMYFVLARKPA
jgi:sterol 24-C-methyltransferase